MTIDQDKAIVRVQAPQDKEIARLSIELTRPMSAMARTARRPARIR